MALSVAASVFFTAVDLTVKTLVAICVGFLITLLTVQLDVVVRLNERTKRQDQHGRLLELIEQQPELLPAFTDMLSSAVSATESARVPLFEKAVRQTVEATRLSLKELEQGRMHCPANDSQVMVAQWAQTRQQVRATTLVDADLTWWRSAVGRKYLKLNEEAIQRGVGVERIFLCDSMTPDVVALLTESRRIGIEVLVVQRTDVPSDLRINVVLYDDMLCVDEVVNSDGDVMSFVYSTNQADLGRLTSSYSRLCAYAQEWTLSSRDVPLPDAHLRPEEPHVERHREAQAARHSDH